MCATAVPLELPIVPSELPRAACGIINILVPGGARLLLAATAGVTHRPGGAGCLLSEHNTL